MPAETRTLLGHPTGLFTLFFAEMWERFSFYGMRALLLFYMLKGFLKYGDADAFPVLGAYTALVYMTPFFGGMLADRLLGARRAVVLGGLLMAAGHLMMTVESHFGFFTALALLICGNGFFKPNISAIVGTLYAPGSPKRDSGFTVFYMGVNLGAAISPLLCGYIGENYGWHYGFGLATVGMLAGLAVFVAPSLIAQLAMLAVSGLAVVNIFVLPVVYPNTFAPGSMALTGTNIGLLVLLVATGAYTFWELNHRTLQQSRLVRWIARLSVLGGSAAIAVLLYGPWFRPENPFSKALNFFVATSLLVAGVVGCVALGRGGLAAEAGTAPEPKRLGRRVLGPITTEWVVYLGTLAAVAVFALLVSGFAPFTADGRPISLVPDSVIKSLEQSGDNLRGVVAVLLREVSRPAGLVLMLSGLVAFGYLGVETFRLPKVPRQRMYVVLILTFFSMLFWTFFEQASGSLNNYADRNVDRVLEERTVAADEVGKTIRIQPTQEQLGYHDGEKLFTMDDLTRLREDHEREPNFTIEWHVAADNVGMGIAPRVREIPASTLQAVNPVYILLFGLAFSALWAVLAKRGWEPGAPVKFSLGLVQLGLGFAAFWYGAVTADARGMVALGWVLFGYLLYTTGELCLSPVGLSMVTRLSPARLVSTVMGGWFLATAFSQFLAAIIGQFTGVNGEGGGGDVAVPPPIETVGLYGGVFGKIAISAIVAGLICFVLSPLLTRWMHTEAETAVGEGEV